MGHEVGRRCDESLTRFSDDGKKRSRMENSVLRYGSPESAVGPGGRAIRKGGLTRGQP